MRSQSPTRGPVAPTARPARALLLASLLFLPVPGGKASGALLPPLDAEADTTWTPLQLRTLGQPPLWHPRGGVALGTGLLGEGRGGEGWVGVRRDLLHPVVGLLGVRFEAVVRGTEEGWAPGGRILLDSPVFLLHAGSAWHRGDTRPSLRVGMSVPPFRGGGPLPGGMLEFGWEGNAGHRVWAGASLPLGSGASHVGRTRPREVRAPLPPPPPRRRVEVRDTPTLPPSRHGQEALEAMGWIATWYNLYAFTDREGIVDREHALRSRQLLALLALEAEARARARGRAPGLGGEIEVLHRSMEAWFEEVAGEGRGVEVGAVAREVLLEEVVLPYNAAVGRLRDPDDLRGLLDRAETRFRRTLALIPGPVAEGSGGAEGAWGAERKALILGVFRAWGMGLEGVRQERATWTRDRRVVWLPLGLVLPAEAHQTRTQVNDILHRALGRPFLEGNDLAYLDSHRFQGELLRTLRETRRLHLLWVHDFRGRNEAGQTDLAAFQVVVEGYLPALLEAIRRHDEGAPFPDFVLLVDQYFYEDNGGRIWMSLLERPLTHDLRLPGRPTALETEVRALQEALRRAVAASPRLQEGRRLHGGAWVEALVRVQVHVTYPSDFTFRARALLPFPLGADNVARDHRKIIVRDLDPEDPQAGELLVGGKGVGEHYVTEGWDDRTLRVSGPSALHVLDEARAVLLDHGLAQADLPLPLRRWPGVKAPAPVEGAPAGAARVLQVHNRVGWGPKEATYLHLLLQDLAPAGTLLWAPDSLWTGPEWMAHMVAAALRGVEVRVVAPALRHAPQPAFVAMSETRELLLRLLRVRTALGPILEEVGGALEVGIYRRGAGTGDLGAQVRELGQAPEWGALGARLGSAVQPAAPAPSAGSAPPPADISPPAAGPPSPPADPGSDPPPFDSPGVRPALLHGKVQLFLPSSSWSCLRSHPELTGFLVLLAGEAGALPRVERGMAALLREPGCREENGSAFLLVGSMNRNMRSLALDGEVTLAVEGEGVGVALLDFLLLEGAITWLEAPEALDLHIPPFPHWQRRLGRHLVRIL